MKKFFVCVLIALAVGGCANYQGPQGPRTVVFLQRGVILQVTHTCTGLAEVHQAGRGLVAVIRGARPQNVPMSPVIWGDREIQVTLISLNESGNVAGTHVERFYIDNASTTSQTWLLSNTWGGSPSRQSRCR